MSDSGDVTRSDATRSDATRSDATRSSATRSDATRSDNRRRYLRYMDGSVQVRLRGSGLLGRFRTVEEHSLIDYNRFGLAFLADTAMEPGADLSLDVDAGSLSLKAVPARVRVCEPRADGYRIGVEFGIDAMRDAAAQRLGHSLHELEKALKRR